MTFPKRVYEPVTMEPQKKTLDVSGWFRLNVETAEYKRTTGGYDSIKIKFAISDTTYKGIFVFHDIVIPPIDKAFNALKTGDGLDYESMTFWMRRTGWMFQVFNCYIDINPEPDDKQICLWTASGRVLPLKRPVLEKIIQEKILQASCVGFLEPGTYVDRDGQTRHKAVLKELRGANFNPPDGFIGDKMAVKDKQGDLEKGSISECFDVENALEEEEDIYLD